jgi:penicillin-binding protein 1A
LNKKRYQTLRKVSLLAGSLLMFFFIFSFGVYIYFSQNLPNIITLKDYNPNIVSVIYDDNNKKIGEFFKEQREIVSYKEIPSHLIQAFVSSEDDKFFQHKGLDFAGIFRAMLVNFKSGKFTQGGSTITQQVARSLLLSSEKKISRKIKEAILASKIEANLSKEEILFLYLNQIYLGYGAYGVKQAAKAYFNKDIKDINLAESALLAGLPQSPSRWSPFINPNKSKERQIYVLKRMVEEGYITLKEAKKTANKRLKLYKRKNLNIDIAPYFTELVRKYVVLKYGNEALLNGGLKIYTSLEFDLHLKAKKSLKNGLKEIDKRQGYMGPIENIETDEKRTKKLLEIHNEIVENEKDYIFFPKIGENFNIESSMFSVISDKNENIQEVSKTPIKKDKTYKALVLNVDKRKIEISVGNFKGFIYSEGYSWCYKRKLSSRRIYRKRLLDPRNVFKKGDLILVSYLEDGSFKVEQEPEVEGAILSINPETGFVKAMVGGYDFSRSEFNRTYQSKRQAGSTFKPIVYSAAIDNGFTPATIVVDSPIIEAFSTDDDKKWKPTNYSGKFYGDTILRDALIFSRNVPTTKIAQKIGSRKIVNYSKKIGIRSHMEKDLSVALGSTAVSLWEMVKVFSVFSMGGKKVVPVFIKKIEDRNGKLLEEYNEENPEDLIMNYISPTLYEYEDLNKKGEELISPQTAYIMSYLLKEVAYHGTGWRVGRALKRPVCGKTGTSNDFMDAWFMGFTPRDITTGVWVGFDDNGKTLGYGEAGARSALPIWLNYMKEALKDRKKTQLQKPSGIKVLKIDKKTGKIANSYSKSYVYLPFKEDSEPEKMDQTKILESADEVDFFRENY